MIVFQVLFLILPFLLCKQTGNPLVCDCELRWYKQWIESEWNEIEETWLKDTYCESPEDGKTHNIEKVDLKEFYCVGAVRDKVGKVVKLCEDISLHSIINNT